MIIDISGLTKQQATQKLDCYIAALTTDIKAKQNQLAELNHDIKQCINKKRAIECGELVE